MEAFDLESLTKERREALAKSIKVATYDELKGIGEEIFRFADDPWREAFFQFIKDNQACTIHHAITSDGVHVVYCRDKDIGMWFLPGSGKGKLQTQGRDTMKRIIENAR